jgi:uncharacterized membrane protein YoaK (UPF0700 family)
VRSVERDLRLLILAASAGSADGWSFFGFGHAFVANMTGNTVLLGLAVSQSYGDVLHPLIALGCYVAGAALGSFLTGSVRPDAVWPRAVSRTLLLEALLLLAAEGGWIAIHLHSSHTPSLDLLLATVALAIGMQSGAMVQLKIPGIVTTYITGTWTTLLSGLVHLARHEGPQGPAQNVAFEERLMTQAAVLSVYFLSVVLTGWFFRHLPLAVGVLPGLSVLLVAVHGLIYHD